MTRLQLRALKDFCGGSIGMPVIPSVINGGDKVDNMFAGCTFNV